MRRTLRAAVVALATQLTAPLLLIAAAACTSDEPVTSTQVLVQIEADPGVRARVRQVALVVRAAMQTAADHDDEEAVWQESLDETYTLRSQGSWPLELSLLPTGGDATRRYEVTATALDADGAPIARVRAISGYRENVALLLRLRFEDACLDKLACTETETCHEGRCHDAHVPIEQLEPYAPPRLLDGAIAEPIDASLSESDAAHGDAGEPPPPLDASADAAVPDASLLDASLFDSGNALDANTPDATTFDPCATDNGGCDPLVSCTGTPSGAQCGACPPGLLDVNADGHECVSCNVATDSCSTLPAACGPTYECGLVGHWKLDESAGTTALDASGHGHNGTIVGGDGDEWGSGDFAGTLALDGVNDRVDLGNISQPGPITVSAWVSAAVPPAFPIVIGKRLNDDAEFVLDYHMPEDRLRFYFGLNSVWRIWTTPVIPNLGTAFTHVAVSYAAGAAPTFYVNGTAVGTVSDTGSGTPERPEVATACSIGGGPYAANSYFYWDGHIDDVRIYERVLTASEVAALAAARPPAP